MGRVFAAVRRMGWRVAEVFAPSKVSWTAAAWALIAFWAFIFGSVFAYNIAPNISAGQVLALVVNILLLALVGLAVLLAARLVLLLPFHYRLALALAVPPAIFMLTGIWDTKGAVIVTALLVLGLSLLAGGLASLLRRDRPFRPIGAIVAIALGVTALGGLTFGLLRTPDDPNPTLTGYRLAGATLPLPDPGKPGVYRVRTYTYGGGTDRYRPEFAAKASWRSKPVDGSKLDTEWKGLGGKLRTAFWGLDPKTFPVQGRVWAPEGPGPFPLVLIVHGNHSMEDFSDPGYAYLGELLASQGFILVSVDENFLNSSLVDRINPLEGRPSKENDARGWMLLEHLVQWRGLNADPKNPLYGKVDMGRIGLIGHSRGGEAVAVAAAFNTLSHYPDDASVPFGYGFNLRAVAAIAPVDGQYKARDRPTPLKDINYFVLHGSMDGDVTSFMGSSQYARDTLTGQVPAFKSALYIKDANHGQFNTSWGRNDLGLPWTALLNLRDILPPNEQRQIAKVYLSAFLQTTLMERTGYQPLFADPRRGAAWLPRGYLAANYADHRTTWAATFEEDLDVATSSAGGAITGRNLSVWREADMKLKSNQMDTQVALVGWDDRVHKAASYSLDLALAAAGTVRSLADH